MLSRVVCDHDPDYQSLQEYINLKAAAQESLSKKKAFLTLFVVKWGITGLIVAGSHTSIPAALTAMTSHLFGGAANVGAVASTSAAAVGVPHVAVIAGSATTAMTFVWQ